jgi:hypothetical protein
MSEEPITKKASSPRELLAELWQALQAWFRSLLDLQEGLDREGTIVTIRTK